MREIDPNIQRKIDSEYDDIGYESGLPPDYAEQVYTPQELGRLTTFEHIIKTANSIESELSNGNLKSWHYVPEGAKPDYRNKIFNLDNQLVSIMRMTAFHMYTGHDVVNPETREITHVPGFVDSEKMLEAADMMLHGFHADKQLSTQFEINELNNLWER